MIAESNHELQQDREGWKEVFEKHGLVMSLNKLNMCCTVQRGVEHQGGEEVIGRLGVLLKEALYAVISQCVR